ncbi:uncharacterized protein LOC129984973 [Argiope bruennichi]|uniref:uncharacterized protein LOC129984973 n=1 Tax=Argiope bruennichi TaxID=94029 RepID=UPI002494F539|nr:uncharacterized protein LOC129984973 [Argiope bruennichi]
MDENTAKIINNKGLIKDKLDLLGQLILDKNQPIITEKAIDDFTPLFWKLRKAKKDLKFCGYLEFASSVVIREVESTFICSFYLLLFLLMLIVGIQYEIRRGADCLSDPFLSLCLIESGFLGCIVNTINLIYFVSGKSNKLVQKGKNLLQGVLFINNFLGK